MDFTNAYQLAINGQEDGYRFLYESTCQPVYDFLLQNTSGKEEADRLIGQVYEKAWAGLGGLADPNAFPGWVQSIAEGMVLQEKNGAPVPPLNANMSPDAGAGANGAMTGGSPVPAAQAEASPNVAHLSSANAQQMTSPNVAHRASGMEQMSTGAGAGESAAATGGSSTASAAAAGAKAATAAKAGVGAKVAFLSTVAGKVTVGIGCAIAAAAMIVGGYFVAKKVTGKEESTTESTEVSSAVIETEEGTDAVVTEEATEAVTEAATEEAKLDIHQLYLCYIRDTLLPEKGMHQIEQQMTSRGPVPGDPVTGPAWFNGSGIYAVDFDDYDLDGAEEMLVIWGEPMSAEGIERYSSYTSTLYRIKADIYDVPEDKVVLRSSDYLTEHYDGYEGGYFPYDVFKVKRDDGIYLFTMGAKVGYRTDASSNATMLIFSTKDEIRCLYDVYYQIAIQWGYSATAFDFRTDPNNDVGIELANTEKTHSEPGIEEKTKLVEDELAMPVYKETVPIYFSDWGIELTDDYQVKDGQLLIHMQLDYQENVYTLDDTTGFTSMWGHSPEWTVDGQTSTEEKTTEQKTEEGKLPITTALELGLSSGAGAWGSGISLNADGSFTGGFHDSDMGSSGQGYDATIYVSNFSGKFKNIQKIDDYTYKMELDTCTTDQPQGTEKIEENVKYVYSEAYGIDNGRVFYLFLPGKPTSEMTEAALGWGWDVEENGKLKEYALYNEDMDACFYTYSY